MLTRWLFLRLQDCVFVSLSPSSAFLWTRASLLVMANVSVLLMFLMSDYVQWVRVRTRQSLWLRATAWVPPRSPHPASSSIFIKPAPSGLRPKTFAVSALREVSRAPGKLPQPLNNDFSWPLPWAATEQNIVLTHSYDNERVSQRWARNPKKFQSNFTREIHCRKKKKCTERQWDVSSAASVSEDWQSNIAAIPHCPPRSDPSFLLELDPWVAPANIQPGMHMNVCVCVCGCRIKNKQQAFWACKHNRRGASVGLCPYYFWQGCICSPVRSRAWLSFQSAEVERVTLICSN